MARSMKSLDVLIVGAGPAVLGVARALQQIGVRRMRVVDRHGVGASPRLFNLPGEAALPLVLSSVRKDGLLLFASEQEALRSMSPGQTLTAVYIGSTLLPCLVTALTIAREQSFRFASSLVLKQAMAAILFSMLLAALCFAAGP